jgi:uncharacterized protein (DUF2237 family)
MEEEIQENVLGAPLETCSMRPLTGFTRSGCCDFEPLDPGQHTVCIVTTEEFLAYSRSRGNDLSTPIPEFEFPGLKPGDRWCLCAARWQEALEDGRAPKVVLRATNKTALEVVDLTDLKRHAIDLS